MVRKMVINGDISFACGLDCAYLRILDHPVLLKPFAHDLRVPFRPVLVEVGFAYGLFAGDEDGDFDEV